MGRKRHKLEEIVAKLRQVEVLTTQGQTWRRPAASPPIGSRRQAMKRISGNERALHTRPSAHHGLESKAILPYFRERLFECRALA